MEVGRDAAYGDLISGVDFDRAVEEVRASTIFTTHTPVPAGNDAFPFPLVETYVSRLGSYGAAVDAYRDRLYSMATHPAAWGPAGCDSGDPRPASPRALGDASVTIQPS